VDNDNAVDVDDAIGLEVCHTHSMREYEDLFTFQLKMLPDGREKIWIHIADVSRWIHPGSFLWKEAERRYAQGTET
jgi:exoribonuclease R